MPRGDVNEIITRLLQVDTLANESVNLVRLKCPYGRQGVNTSDWSRQSKCWEQVSTSEKDRLGRDHLGDGEFYLSFVDFVQTFTSLECVHLDAETSRDEPTLQGKGMWIRSFSILYGQITIFYINISVSWLYTIYPEVRAWNLNSRTIVNFLFSFFKYFSIEFTISLSHSWKVKNPVITILNMAWSKFKGIYWLRYYFIRNVP